MPYPLYLKSHFIPVKLELCHWEREHWHLEGED